METVAKDFPTIYKYDGKFKSAGLFVVASAEFQKTVYESFQATKLESHPDISPPGHSVNDDMARGGWQLSPKSFKRLTPKTRELINRRRKLEKFIEDTKS